MLASDKEAREFVAQAVEQIYQQNGFAAQIRANSFWGNVEQSVTLSQAILAVNLALDSVHERFN